jgi:hypothetical protein
LKGIQKSGKDPNLAVVDLLSGEHVFGTQNEAVIMLRTDGSWSTSSPLPDTHFRAFPGCLSV